jgi:hypothetical protein
MDLFKSTLFGNIKMLILLLYFICFSLNQTTNEQSNKLYPKMINIPNDKFLFVIINGIYIFETNLLDKEKIYTFRGSQIIDRVEDINKTTLSDITYNGNYYVFCLVKDFLYLFDNNKKKIIKELDLNSYLDGKSYTLNPFINGTYLSCIISYTKEISYENIGNIYKLNLYEINFLNVNENNNDHFISKREYFNQTYVDSYSASYISSNSSTCQISSNILYCFYFIDDSQKIRVSGFDLSNNYELISYNEYLLKRDIGNFMK